jgi:hypothetical protein
MLGLVLAMVWVVMQNNELRSPVITSNNENRIKNATRQVWSVKKSEKTAKIAVLAKNTSLRSNFEVGIGMVWIVMQNNEVPKATTHF